MKRFIKIAAVLAALVAAPSVMAQEVTQAQKDGSAKMVSECVIKYAPANWEMITTMIDRKDLQKPVLYNMALVKGSKKAVDIDVSNCDSKKQVNDLLKFQAILPVDQKDWTYLVLRVTPNGAYEVFTNIGWERSLAQQNAMGN